MTSFNVAPFYLYNEENDGTVQRYTCNSNIWVGIFFFYAYGWLALQNEWILLPWSLVSMTTPAFYEYGMPQWYGYHGNSHVIFAQNNCKFNR